MNKISNINAKKNKERIKILTNLANDYDDITVKYLRKATMEDILVVYAHRLGTLLSIYELDTNKKYSLELMNEIIQKIIKEQANKKDR